MDLMILDAISALLHKLGAESRGVLMPMTTVDTRLWLLFGSHIFIFTVLLAPLLTPPTAVTLDPHGVIGPLNIHPAATL